MKALKAQIMLSLLLLSMTISMGHHFYEDHGFCEENQEHFCSPEDHEDCELCKDYLSDVHDLNVGAFLHDSICVALLPIEAAESQDLPKVRDIDVRGPPMV